MVSTQSRAYFSRIIRALGSPISLLVRLHLTLLPLAIRATRCLILADNQSLHARVLSLALGWLSCAIIIFQFAIVHIAMSNFGRCGLALVAEYILVRL